MKINENRCFIEYVVKPEPGASFWCLLLASEILPRVIVFWCFQPACPFDFGAPRALSLPLLPYLVVSSLVLFFSLCFISMFQTQYAPFHYAANSLCFKLVMFRIYYVSDSLWAELTMFQTQYA